jgi:hypothetical protein
LLASGDAGSTPGPGGLDRSRLLRRRAFAVEVWMDGEEDDPRVAGTRVVDLETSKADAWSGWNVARLLAFLETRMTPAGPVDPEPPPTAGELGAEPPGGAPRRPARLVHRYGVLAAAALVPGRGDVAARLRLDPGGLELPFGQTGTARVELFAQPVAGKRAVALDDRLIELTGGAVDAVLRGRTPELDVPFRIFATVRILVDRPDGSPKDDLGDATLDIVAG